jgi:hypothetical protein
LPTINDRSPQSYKEEKGTEDQDLVKAFEEYFIELNDKAQEKMNGSSPEPERALELLKQVQEFLHQIEKAKKKQQDSFVMQSPLLVSLDGTNGGSCTICRTKDEKQVKLTYSAE